MREGYGSRSVWVCCVCLYVTSLGSTYLIFESKVKCYKVPYGIPNGMHVLYGFRSFADSKILHTKLSHAA